MRFVVENNFRRSNACAFVCHTKRATRYGRPRSRCSSLSSCKCGRGADLAHRDVAYLDGRTERDVLDDAGAGVHHFTGVVVFPRLAVKSEFYVEVLGSPTSLGVTTQRPTTLEGTFRKYPLSSMENHSSVRIS